MPSSHPILCHPLLLLPSIHSSIRVFFNESTRHMRWPKYWSFSFSIIPSKEHPGLISFKMDWLDLLAVLGTQESSPIPQFKSVNSSALSFLHSPTLTSIHDRWKNHSLWVVPCQMVMTFINIKIHMALQFEKELMFTWSGHWEGCLLWVIVKCQKEVFLKSTKSCNTRMWMAATLCPQFLIQRLQLSDHLQL